MSCLNKCVRQVCKCHFGSSYSWCQQFCIRATGSNGDAEPVCVNSHSTQVSDCASELFILAGKAMVGKVGFNWKVMWRPAVQFTPMALNVSPMSHSSLVSWLDTSQFRHSLKFWQCSAKNSSAQVTFLDDIRARKLHGRRT